MALVRRERNSVDDMDDAVLGHTVGNNHSRIAIHLDGGKPKNAGNVDTDVCVAEQRGQVVVLARKLLNWLLLLLRLSLVVERIGVECSVGHNVILENGL